jgi:hypothetical protein
MDKAKLNVKKISNKNGGTGKIISIKIITTINGAVSAFALK